MEPQGKNPKEGGLEGPAPAGPTDRKVERVVLNALANASGTTRSTPEDAPKAQLTPEEQMALYEKELKETDWGHQPC